MTKQASYIEQAEPVMTTVQVDDIIPPIAASKPPKALLDSIANSGVVVPVVLQSTHDGTPGHRIIDGRRRVAAARKLGLADIPAQVFPPDWLGSAPAMTVTLNELRWASEYSETVAILELAHAGHSDAEIADLTGMPVVRVRKRLELATLHPDLMEGFADGRFVASVAEAAAKLPKEQQERLAVRMAAGEKITGPVVREMRLATSQAYVEQVIGDVFHDVPSVPPPTLAAMLAPAAQLAIRQHGMGLDDWLAECRAAYVTADTSAAQELPF
jgi:ParB-like chromosome segregation protein Spo0J